MAPSIRVVAPSTGALIAEVPDEGASGAVDAVAAARAAAPAWAARPLAERVDAVKRWRDAVLDASPAVAGTLVAESGKPRHEAEVIEILYLCELIRFGCRSARRALAEETDREEAGVSLRSAVPLLDPPRDAPALPPGPHGKIPPPFRSRRPGS